MNTTRGIFAIAISVFLFLPQLVAAQQVAPGTVEEELHALGLHTGETVRLLRQLVAKRAVDQKLKRLQVAVLALQLRSNTIGEIDRRIRTLEDRATEVRDLTANFEAESRRIEEMAQNDSITDENRAQLQSSRTQIETQIDLAAQRLWSLESQIFDLQNELASKRRDVDALEEIVMEGLGDL
jgi:chromosome segregation ATPase